MTRPQHFYPVSQPPPIDRDEDEIDLGQLVKSLWRGKWIIFASVLLCVAVAANHVNRVAVPIYSASASVVLEEDAQKSLALSDYDPSLSFGWYTIGTQTRILTSRQLARKVVLQAGLLEDPYFNPYIPWPEGEQAVGTSGGPLEWAISLAQRAKSTVANWTKPQQNVPESPSVALAEDDILAATANAALGAISILNDPDTYVFDITASTPYPEKSAMLATAWAKAYVQDQRDVKIEETQETSQWLGEQVAELRVQLEVSEEEFSSFQSDADLINSRTLDGLNRQLKITRDRYENESAAGEIIDSKLKNIQELLFVRNFDALSDILRDRLFSQLRANLDSKRPETLIAIEERVDVLTRNLFEEREVSRQRQLLLTQAIQDLENRVAVQSEELVRYEQLNREVETNKIIYEFFLTKLKEVSVQTGTLKADSRVLSTAIVPGAPVSPQKKRVLALALVLGVFIGSGIVLLFEFLNTKFRTSEELEDATGYLVIGRIPLFRGSDRRQRLNSAIENCLSHEAEALRNLRTSLLLSNIDKPPKVVMVTSSLAGEGKTTISLALAANLSNLDKKILLVECDIRRRTFREYFDHNEEQGLISVLSGDADLNDCLYQDKILGCDVLFADAPKVNSVDLFSSHRFKDFLDEMRGKYDLIVLDTPPILIVSDARVIAPFVDATLFVARWNKTSTKNVRDGLRALEDIGVRATGLVMSQISLKGMKAYGHRSDPLYSRESMRYYADS